MDVRYLWNKVNNLRNERINNFPIICINNENFAHPRTIAGEFAKYWTAVSSDTAFDANIVSSKKSLDIGKLQQ